MSRALLTLGLPVVGLLGAAVLPDRAEACSPPYPGLTGRRMHPPDGTANVPLNVRPVVRYEGGHPGNPLAPNVSPLGSDLQLRKMGGAVVPITTRPMYPRTFHAPPEVGPSPPRPARSKGGCSLASSPDRGDGTWLAGLLLFGTWLPRRRRRS